MGELLLQRVVECERLEATILKLKKRLKQKQDAKKLKQAICEHEVSIYMGELSYSLGWSTGNSVSMYQCLLCGENFKDRVGTIVDAKDFEANEMGYEEKAKTIRKFFKEILEENPNISLSEAIERLEQKLKEKNNK